MAKKLLSQVVVLLSATSILI
ncbi:MAG: hypothetical protein RLZZ252_561, partial [Bacteroidota bacterium]